MRWCYMDRVRRVFWAPRFQATLQMAQKGLQVRTAPLAPLLTACKGVG